LVELIRQSGWVKPLVVTPKHVIISGHRRWKAVCLLGWETVLVEVRDFASQIAELEALLLENASRTKTTEQKVREGEAWRELESSKAKIRQTANLKIGNLFPVRENFPTRETGRVSSAIADRVGLGSGRNYSKAAKVVTQIDEEANQGHLEIAQALRKVLNEQSVDAAHGLIKESPQERHAIASLIVSGEAKTIKQAVRMVKQKMHAEFNAPSQATLAGFSTGDWVTVNYNAQSKTYIGLKGQIEQILVVESQISVILDDGPSKIRFYPHELTLIAKATPLNPFSVGDLVLVNINRHEAASAQEKKWNGCWGKVTQIGEMGSVTVDVGKESLQLFPRDLKPTDAPASSLHEVVDRVLLLRHLELDEVESIVLDVIQRREWFTPRQLDYLDFMENFYLPKNKRSINCKHAVVPSVL
jgi:ribosomal protein L21E